MNRCGFHIGKFFNKFHSDPNELERDAEETDVQFPDGVLRFEKRIDQIPVRDCKKAQSEDKIQVEKTEITAMYKENHEYHGYRRILMELRSQPMPIRV